MKYFITFFQATKNGDRIFHGRLVDLNRLEPSFQSRVFFNILTVFIQCGRTNTVQLAPRQHRLEHISGIHRAVRLSGSYDQVQLIDEQDDLSIAFADFLQNGFQTLLKLSAVLCSCHQRSHVQGKDCFIFQALRHIPVGNTLRQPFYDCRLTYAGFTDQNRIVFGLSGKNTDHIPDLCVTSDDRIQLLASGFFHQILSVFFQCVIGCFRIVRGDSLVAPHGAQRLKKAFPGNSIFLKQLFHRRARVLQHRQEQMLYGNVFIPHRLCLVLRADQRFVQILADVWLSAGYLDSFIQSLRYPVDKVLFLNFHLLDHFQDQAVLLVEKIVQQVLLLYLLISKIIGGLFQVLNSLQ